MPKYLIKANYTVEGIRGLQKEGGTGRREAVEKLLSGLGGTLEAFYYAFGDTDVYLIVELPDNISAAAINVTVAAAGAVGLETTVLLTPEEIDEASKKSVDYRPPGA